ILRAAGSLPRRPRPASGASEHASLRGPRARRSVPRPRRAVPRARGAAERRRGPGEPRGSPRRARAPPAAPALPPPRLPPAAPSRPSAHLGLDERLVLATGRRAPPQPAPAKLSFSIRGEYELRYRLANDLRLQRPLSDSSATYLGQNQYLYHWLRLTPRLR